jgi:hypothetical protein
MDKKNRYATSKGSRFKLFRYQLLPVNRYFQGDLYGAATIDDLLKKKNEIFLNALLQTPSFSSARVQITATLLLQDRNFLLYRVAASRPLKRELLDFRVEQVENWPSILILILNDPDKQLIAVQERAVAFQKASSVVSVIFDAIEPLLSRNQICAIWEPLFEKSMFWDLVKRYKGLIKEIEFEIVTPNMANISRALSKDLSEFGKSMNSIKNKITVKSDPKSALNVSEQNSNLQGLVSYSAEGGGNISLRVSGIKEKIRTEGMTKELLIDDAQLEGKPEDIMRLFKQFFE